MRAELEAWKATSAVNRDIAERAERSTKRIIEGIRLDLKNEEFINPTSIKLGDIGSTEVVEENPDDKAISEIERADVLRVPIARLPENQSRVLVCQIARELEQIAREPRAIREIREHREKRKCCIYQGVMDKKPQSKGEGLSLEQGVIAKLMSHIPVWKPYDPGECLIHKRYYHNHTLVHIKDMSAALMPYATDRKPYEPGERSIHKWYNSIQYAII